MAHNNSGQLMRSVIVFAGLALASGFLGPRYALAYRRGAGAAAGAPDGAGCDARQPARASIVVPRDERGHFEVDARVDGRRVSFMVDTGASVIALTANDAARLGIHPSQNAFVAEVKTANGKVRAAPAHLDVVEIGESGSP